MRYISTSDNLQTSGLELSLRLAVRMVHQLASSAYESRWLNICTWLYKAVTLLVFGYDQVHLGREFSLIALPSRLASLQNKLLPRA